MSNTVNHAERERERFTTSNSYTRKAEKYQINSQSPHLRNPENSEINPNQARKREIGLRAEIHNVETRKTVEKKNEIKTSFL